MPPKKAAAAEPQQIVVPEIRIEKMRLRIVGLAPLVIHQFSEKAKQMIRDKQAKKAKTGGRDIREPEREYNEARYRLADGRDGYPAGGIRNAIIEACSFVQDVTKVHTRGAIFVNRKDVLVPIEREPGVAYGVDVHPTMREDMVRVGGKGPGTGAADIRYRPEYDPWSIPILVEFDGSIMSPSQVINLIKRAGFSIGIGEGRPQKGRQWGMFDVVADDADDLKQAAE